MRSLIKSHIHRKLDWTSRRLPLGLARNLPLHRWPRLLGLFHGFKVPRGVPPLDTPRPSGSANVNILLDLLSETQHVPGQIAECGVYRGAMLLSLSLALEQRNSQKRVFGFDSFQGFDDQVLLDQRLGGAPLESKRVGGFSDTSYEGLAAKLRQWDLDLRTTLVKGYFEETLPRFREAAFSLVHLDCDLYQSYRTTLEFFYPRVSPGGVILFDEYNDPPWPGCNKAVDEFLQDKPESPILIERNNYQKWFIRKQK